MKKITVSAPGKLMLFGEHAVLYGRPCIVTAVGQRMKAIVELIDKPEFQLNAPDVEVKTYKKPMDQLGLGDIPKGARFVEIAAKNFISHTRPGLTRLAGIKVTTNSEFNAQFGFGSSSASTVCVLKALSELTGAKLSNKAIFKLAFKTILDIQGKGSGFDVAAATFGGTLYYVIGGKVLKPLNLSSLPLIIGYTGIKADTVNLVKQVKERAEKFPKVIDDIYDSIAYLVNMAEKALLKGDFQTAGELMNFNEEYLAALGVSSGKLESMIHGARDAGAYGAKLSGAGVGDCMITLAPPGKVSAVKKAISKAGGVLVNVKANAEGVKIEK